MIAIGRISGGKPISAEHRVERLIRNSIAPLARNIAIANRIATRYGMIRTATRKPSLAPSTNSRTPARA